jgi:hypothetical protein
MSRRETIREKILARCIVDPVTGCWLWQGPTSGKNGRGAGYGRMTLDGATVAVHKAMWTNEHGLIPPRKELDHVCRNRLCCNPDNDKHVEMVTRLENARRRDAAIAAEKIDIVDTF